MIERIERLRSVLGGHGAGALLVTHPADVRWTTGFTGSNALVVLTPTRAHLVTDGRYAGQAAQEASGVEVHAPGYDLVGHVAAADLIERAARILFAPEHVTAAALSELEDALGESELVPAARLVGRMRMEKDEGEIDAIRAALRLTESVFSHILGMIGPGVTERDIGAEIVYQHLKGGAEAMAFEPIVASGRRSALPHGRASDRALAAGDVVLIDMGCYLGGYASDLTRTVVVGEPEQGVRAVYEAVLEAQLAAIDTLAPGVSVSAADATAREVLAGHGLAEYFSHSLGHGVGLEVHEEPRLSVRASGELPINAVVTVEPGVYLPERFGIRIEDMVVVREGGPEVLTTLPRALRSV